MAGRRHRLTSDEAHLRACADCRGRLAREERLLAAITHSLGAAMNVEPSDAFTRRVRSRVAEERCRVATAGPRWQVPVAAAAAVTLAAAVWVVSRRPPAPAAPPAASMAARTEPPRPARTDPAAVPSSPARARSVSRSPVKHGPSPGSAREVLVEPGQLEAVSRLARASGAEPIVRFVLGGVDAEAALPALLVADVPRLEMRPLEPMAPPWTSDAPEGEAAVPENDEGSGS